MYFLFQVIKALSRNSLTATVLGKDVIATFTHKIIPKLTAHAEKKSSFVAKLKVSLETLQYLTKPSKQSQNIMFRSPVIIFLYSTGIGLIYK